MLDAGMIVRVQIEDLKQYAAQLQGEIDAVESTASWLTVSPELGSFPQAEALRARHDEVLTGMVVLLDKVKTGIDMAQTAAQQIAKNYTTADLSSKVRISDVTSVLGAPAERPGGRS